MAVKDVFGVFHRPGPGEEQGGFGVGPFEEVAEETHGPRPNHPFCQAPLHQHRRTRPRPHVPGDLLEQL